MWAFLNLEMLRLCYEYYVTSSSVYIVKTLLSRAGRHGEENEVEEALGRSWITVTILASLASRSKAQGACIPPGVRGYRGRFQAAN